MTDSDSDEFNRPSCSGNNGRGVGGRNRTRNNNDENQKRKRRIVMRIEFDDDDDTDETSSIEATGGEDGDSQLVDLDVDARPSCSTRRLRSRAPTKTQNQATNDDEDSNTLRRTFASRRLRNQHARISSNDSDSEKDVGVSSGSEINESRKSRVKKPKKYVVSEDELDLQPSTSTKSKADDAGFSSDSSSNELLEKCPICLLTFRQQEIGTPATCEHIYCAGCIEAWSKNVQTCPIDRLEFDKIIVRESYENRRIVREINVNPNTTNKELRLDDDDDVIYIGDEEDVTNCEICNSSEREDVMLLCDACNQGYHMDCLDPPLSVIPAGSWYCDNCFDSMDEDDEVDDAAEDLSMLYEDIRDMGLPETRLRVREVQQPRILRTRLNERLRAAIMRRTRSSTTAAAAAVAGVNTETTTTTRTTRQNGRSTDRTTTTTTTTTTRTTTRSTSKRGTRATTGRRRRRRARQRTYVVEYDLNNYDEKFAIKTTRKVIRRRRRKARSSRRTSAAASAAAANGVRLTASQRLAEQMGVKVDYNRSAFRKDGVPTLSLFGHANDLEYFSDSDGGMSDDGISNQVQIDSGHGTAVQTSVRISSIGAPRSRKALLLGKLQRGSQQAPPTVATNAGQVDILSSIMDMQDRWHNAARNMSQVHISQDGSLSLPPATPSTTNSGEQANQAPQSSTTTQHVTEAPMYPRGGGGGGSKFNSGRGGGGGSSGGNYNNRYGNNTSNYHGGGGGGGGSSGVGAGNPYQRHSTGGMMDNSNSGFGNHNFNNSANNNNNNGTGQQNIHFTPFNMRFNPRNQRLNQRQSLPFNARNEHQQQQQQQQQLPNSQTTTPTNFSIPPPNVTDSNQLFGGLPAPTNQPPPSHIIANAPPIRAQPTVGVGVGVGVSPLAMPPILTVPPPPAPPPGIQPPWNSTLFKLTADYGNQGDDDDDDSNCPNFSVYSQESQAVAKSAESAQAESTAQAAKDDDDINEDLVQLDDDDDIPMPPDDKPQNDTTTTTATATTRNTTDLYEPENPTDETEQHDKHIDLDTSETDSNDVKTSKKQNSSKNINNSKNRRGNDQYDPEEDTNSTFGEAASLADSVKTDKEDTRNEAGATAIKRPTPSPTLTESRLTESEPAVVDSRKGVLELYDDSDWEELDIDKPKEYEKAIEKADETVATTTPTTERSATAEDSQANGQDRSYTPCLDEKNDEEEVHLVDGEVVSQESVDSTAVIPERLSTKDKTKGGDGKKSNEQPERVGDIETELISDEEDMTGNDEGKRRSRSKRRAGSKAKTRTSKHERNENVETFKKVSNKQKGRNYRIDKQLTPSRRRGSRAPRSLSRTPPLRSISRSRTRSKSKSRSRTRSRSPRRRRDGSRSPTRSRSRSHYSRSVSPRNRYRGRGGSAGGNFNKENNFRGGRGGGNFGGRGGSGGRYNQRNPRFNNFNQGYRQKRRELPRYDVRNVVGYPRGQQKDRYGRDTQRHLRSRSQSFNRRRAHSHSYSRSNSRSRPRSVSPKRGRGSFSMSPSPSSLHNRPFAGATQRAGRSSLSPRRYGAPRHVSHSPMPLARRITPLRERTQSPLRLGSRSRSRSIHSPQRLNGRKPAGVGKRTRGESPLFSPRYTPRLSHSRSRSRSKSPKKMKKKKKGDKKHKKKKQRATSGSPTRNRRISRQRDPFLDDDVDLLMPQRKKHRHSPKPGPSSAAVVAPAGVGIGGNMGRWSPSLSLSPPPHGNYVHELDKNTSWTPPLRSTVAAGLEDEFDLGMRRSISRLSKKEKRKRIKKKKKTTLEKREMRKEKRRKRRTKTPEPQPSKEVFASGNNILVSVSFNKDTTNASTSVANSTAQQQTTVVTLPPTREDLLVAGRRTSIDRLTNSSISKKTKKDKTRKRKKLEAKPVAIIDLERSPFQVHQEPADIIVLTDSEDANDNNSMVRRERNRRSASVSEHEHRERDEHHRMPLAGAHQHDKTPPAERMDTIMETSYESLPQTSSAMMTTGPKTPPEPPIVKFNLPAKKQHKLRNNPLHDDADDLASDNELGNVVVGRDTQRDESQPHETMNSQKIGPNTPPESGPCSPDAYDPFEPTKSPSLSPRSPTPPPLMDTAQNVHGDIGSIGGTGGSGGIGVGSGVGNTDGHETSTTTAQKHNQINEDATSSVNAGVGNTNNNCAGQTGTTLNPVDLVMALMNSKTNNAGNDMTNKSTDTQYSNLHNSSNVNTTDDNMRDKADESNNAITVLSNVLLSNPSTSTQQHIPVISSPTPPSLAKKLAQLPKPGSGSVGSSSATNMPLSNANLRNGSGSGGMDDSFNLDIESPYSPGSADYEDLFEPPPDNPTTRRNKRGAKTEMFDNLFGSSSPIRMSNYGTTASKAKASKANNKNERKSRIKVGKSDDHIKVYDDVPNSAVELQVKDKFLRKLNRQERVVEEVKLVLKPHFNKKIISKDDYKDIMRRAVPKICHSRSGEINPHKIKNLIDAYVKKFRAKHKKLNPLNTGQVSSAVKCAAYLKKL